MDDDRIKEVKGQFNSLRDKRRQGEAERISTMKRLEEANRRFSALQKECDAIKIERQKTLAEGGDHAALSKKLKGVEDDIVLVTEEITGLKWKIEDLIKLDASLGNQISTENFEIARLRIVDLAQEYNKLCESLAPIIKQLLHCRDDLAGTHVVWADFACEIFQKVPRISFEPNVHEYFYHRDRHGI